MSRSITILSCYIFAIFCICTVVRAEDQDIAETHLLGDWGGALSYLDNNGVSLESILTLDSISNVSGGIKRKEGTLFNADLTMSIDTSKAGLWNGGTLFVYMLGNAGNDPTSYVGDLQASDNIETNDTFKLYEAWYDQSIADGMFSVLFGLHDYNSEFNALDYSSTLINSSFGIEPDISQVGPSIFSTTAVGARIKIQPSSQFYVLSALYDGIPGDPNDARGTQIIYNRDEGLFSAVELGIISPEDAAHYKYALGGWYHTTDYEDFQGVNRSSNGGLYFVAEHTLLSESDDDQGLGAFAQFGFTQPDRNQIGNYVGAGFSYIGMIPDREADVFAFGLAYARISPDYRRLVDESALSETALELTYRVEITPYFAMQPDLQYIFDPGGIENQDDAVVIGLRTELSL